MQPRLRVVIRVRVVCSSTHAFCVTAGDWQRLDAGVVIMLRTPYEDTAGCNGENNL
jgi:hypothetical protein